MMASRQFLKWWSPLLNSASRHLHASLVTQRCQTVINQSLASRLTSVRYLSKGGSSEIINIQDEDDFKMKVLESEKPVIVDFHASWCGPCKLLGPRLEAVVAEEKGRVIMAKVDIDEQIDLAMHFKVDSVPTVCAFKDGKIVNKFIGLKDDDEIKGFLQNL